MTTELISTVEVIATIVFLAGVVFLIINTRKVNKHNKNLKEKRIAKAKENIPIMLENITPGAIRDSIRLLEEAGADPNVVKSFKAQRSLIRDILSKPNSDQDAEYLMKSLITNIVNEMNNL